MAKGPAPGMRIRDSVYIDRAPAVVWAFVADPERLPSWNPKAQAVSPVSRGPAGEGYRYRVRYVMRGKPYDLDAEMHAFEPPRRLLVHLTGQGAQGAIRAHELYELRPERRGTRLTQTLELLEPPIPWPWRWALLLLGRLAQPAGRRYLDGLRWLIEAGA